MLQNPFRGRVMWWVISVPNRSRVCVDFLQLNRAPSFESATSGAGVLIDDWLMSSRQLARVSGGGVSFQTTVVGGNRTPDVDCRAAVALSDPVVMQRGSVFGSVVVGSRRNRRPEVVVFWWDDRRRRELLFVDSFQPQCVVAAHVTLVPWKTERKWQNFLLFT